MQADQVLPARLPTPRSSAGLAVFGVHALLFWALLQLDDLNVTLRQVTTQVVPLMVRLVSPPDAVAPAPTLPTPAPRAAAAPAWPPLPLPAIEIPSRPAPAAEPAAAARPAPAATSAADMPAAPPPAPIAAAIAPPPPPVPSAAPPAAVPQQLATGALRYLVEPAVVVPRLSRRAGEQGTVLLHVLVDAQGLPRSVTLRRSSGYARLDEQAQAAMRAARFVPCTDQGRPVECEADAPIVYELQP